MSEVISIGEFIKPHGIHGELLLLLYNPLSDALNHDIELLIKENEGFRRLKVKRIRPANKGFLIKLYGVDSIEQAEKFKKIHIFIKKTDLILKDGEYLISDLIGLNCFNEKNKKLGAVSDIYSGETDIMEIKSGNGIYLVPMTENNVTLIDAKNFKICIKNEENYKI